MIKRSFTTIGWCLVLGVVSCPILWARPIIGDPLTDDRFSELAVMAIGNSTTSFFTTNSQSSPFASDSDSVSSLTRGMGAVVLVIGMILSASFLARRLWPQRFGPQTSRRQIEVIESVALGDRHSLTLVKVGTCSLLLGRTPAGMTLLERIELLPEVAAEEAVERDANAAKSELVKSSGFSLHPHAYKVFRRVSGKLRLAIERVRLALAHHGSNDYAVSPTMRVANSPSFEQVMSAQLQNDETKHLISRLGQIRGELQSR